MEQVIAAGEPGRTERFIPESRWVRGNGFRRFSVWLSRLLLLHFRYSEVPTRASSAETDHYSSEADRAGHVRPDVPAPRGLFVE